MGAWIEIIEPDELELANDVAPLVGAWIEIRIKLATKSGSIVAPLVGAWIEIMSYYLEVANASSRSSRGSVD